MKPHRFDSLSFVSGLLLVLVGLAFLLPARLPDLAYFTSRFWLWIWPVLLVTIGIAILVPAFLPKKDQEDGSAGV